MTAQDACQTLSTFAGPITNAGWDAGASVEAVHPAHVRPGFRTPSCHGLGIFKSLIELLHG